MPEVSKWLIDNGGLWGVVVLILAWVVIYLDRRSTRAYDLRIASQDLRILGLEKEKEALQLKLDKQHEQGKADAQANTQALLNAADKHFQGVTHLHEIASALKR